MNRLRFANVVSSLVAIAVNGLSALLPMSLLAAVSNVYGNDLGGQMALVTTVAAFVAQVSNAWVVEARLVGNGGTRSLAFSGPLRGLAFGGAVLWGLGFALPMVGYVGVVVALSMLEISRNIAIVIPELRRDVVVGCVLALAAGANFVSPSEVSIWFVSASTALIAIAVRVWRIPLSVDHYHIRGGRWVVWETVVNGAVQPLAVSQVLGGLGGPSATAYRLTMGLANLFSPVLSFLRMRLLGRRSKGDVLLSLLLFVCVSLVVILGQWSGFWVRFFGTGWALASLTGLVGALTWKLVGICTTVPFAALRRSGNTKVLFVLRTTSSLLMIVAATVVVGWEGRFELVIWSFVACEALTFIMYAAALFFLRRSLRQE